MADPLAGLGGPGLGGGGLGGITSRIKPAAVWKVILLFSGFFAVVFGLMLASRYFGFPLFFDINLSDEALIQLSSLVMIVTGAFTLIREIRGGNAGGIGDLKI